MKNLKKILGISFLVQSVSFGLLFFLLSKKKKSYSKAFAAMSILGALSSSICFFLSIKDVKKKKRLIALEDCCDCDDDFDEDYDDDDDLSCSFEDDDLFDDLDDEEDAEGDQEDEEDNGALDFKTMSLLAVATSIDALAVGVSFACIQVKIWTSVLVIGITTFLFSILGVKIGNVFGSKFEKSAEITGGIILILIGLKILLEHLGFLAF